MLPVPPPVPIHANLKAHITVQATWQIEMLSGGKDDALCCYEKPGDFCHRHILAKWITENTGIEITEFGVVEKKEPEYEQASLF